MSRPMRSAAVRRKSRRRRPKPPAAWSPWDAAAHARAAAAFELQMWVWGRDSLRRAGNVLAWAGLSRDGCPAGQVGSTCYRREEPGRRLVLWGWGVSYGREGTGGLFARRLGLELLWRADATAPRNLWAVGELTGFRSPATAAERDAVRLLTAEWLAWMADYERRVVGHFGADYRRECVEGREGRSPVPPDGLADAWDALRRELFSTDCEQGDSA